MKNFVIEFWDEMMDGNWHHFAIVHEDDEVFYYLDGKYYGKY